MDWRCFALIESWWWSHAQSASGCQRWSKQSNHQHEPTGADSERDCRCSRDQPDHSHSWGYCLLQIQAVGGSAYASNSRHMVPGGMRHEMKKFLLGSFGLGLLGAWACEPTVRWGDRSPSENEIKACHGADGSWVCSGPEVGLSKIPRKFTAGFGPNTPTSLPNWSVPLWVVDKHNRSGCAKDTNTCTSTTCGGGPVGPCATKAQITSRWGC